MELDAPELEHDDLPEAVNETSGSVLDAAVKVHQALGPGLLERTYRLVLAHELRKRGHLVREEVVLPLVYEELVIDRAYRMDLVVDGAVVVEIKAQETLLKVHAAQLRMYLKLSGHPVGLLFDFHAPLLTQQMKRIVQSAPLSDRPPRSSALRALRVPTERRQRSNKSARIPGRTRPPTREPISSRRQASGTASARCPRAPARRGRGSRPCRGAR